MNCCTIIHRNLFVFKNLFSGNTRECLSSGPASLRVQERCCSTVSSCIWDLPTDFHLTDPSSPSEHRNAWAATAWPVLPKTVYTNTPRGGVLFLPIWHWPPPPSSPWREQFWMGSKQRRIQMKAAGTQGRAVPAAWTCCFPGPLGATLEFRLLSLFCSCGFELDSYLPGGSVVKNPPANAGDADMGLIPRSGRFPGGGNGNPLQYSCWEKFMGRGAWGDHGPWGPKESDTTEHAGTLPPAMGRGLTDNYRNKWKLKKKYLNLEQCEG